MTDIKLITFDCYGTLIDWETGISHVIDRIARDLNLKLPTRKLASRYVELEFSLEQSGEYRPYEEILALGMRLLFAERNVFLDERHCLRLAASLPTWKPFPETKKVLKSLRQRGYKLGVVSNIDDKLLGKSLKGLGIRFDYRVTSQDVSSYKPRTKHWEKMMSLAKIGKKNWLHVAASQIHDIIPAKTLGLPCVWINRHRTRKGSARPDHVFYDLTPLPALLRRNRAASRRI